MAEILNEELLDEVSGGKSKKKKKHKVDWHCQQCNVESGQGNVSVYKVNSNTYVCSARGHVLNADKTYTGRIDTSLLD